MPPAIVAAGIGAAGAIGGAMLGSSAQKKAASQAANAQTQAAQQQLQLGRETNALNREIYDKNAALLNPFVQRGNVAGDQINALLGLSAPTVSAPASSGMSREDWANGALNAMGLGSRGDSYGTLQGHLAGQIEGQLPANTRQAYDSYAQSNPAPSITQAAPQQANSLNPQQAFENFANSAGMKFQIQQGTNALQNSAAARGMLQSGATLKGLQNYGQQTLLNNYFMPYMSLLGGQQSTGAGAASSVAGVGQNFVNTAGNIMGHQSNAIQGGANALSNAAIARGVANSNMWSGIGGALGTFASSFGGRP